MPRAMAAWAEGMSLRMGEAGATRPRVEAAGWRGVASILTGVPRTKTRRRGHCRGRQTTTVIVKVPPDSVKDGLAAQGHGRPVRSRRCFLLEALPSIAYTSL